MINQSNPHDKIYLHEASPSEQKTVFVTSENTNENLVSSLAKHLAVSIYNSLRFQKHIKKESSLRLFFFSFMVYPIIYFV